MQRFTHLPSVLVQDPRVDQAYFIDASAFAEFEMSPERLVSIDQGVVTFSIPNDEFVEVTPPFNSLGSERPAIIVQHLAANKAYFLTYEQLQAFRVDQPSEYGGYGISFVIPSGNEFLEDLSPVQFATLQSGESGDSGPVVQPSPVIAKDKAGLPKVAS